MNATATMMKKLPGLVIALLLSCAGGSVYAQSASFQECGARVMGDQVVIQWQTGMERGVVAYDVERKGPNEAYKRLGRVTPKGAGVQYSFVDNSAFFRTNEARQYSYRIKVVGSVETYSRVMSVALEVAGVRKSWGMIKELFR